MQQRIEGRELRQKGSSEELILLRRGRSRRGLLVWTGSRVAYGNSARNMTNIRTATSHRNTRLILRARRGFSLMKLTTSLRETSIAGYFKSEARSKSRIIEDR